MKGGKRAKGKSTEKAEVQERLDDIARRAALVLSDEQDCGTRCSPSSSKKRGTMAEKAEDELLLKRDESETDEKRGTTAISQPRILKNGTLRSYQMVGLQWLVELYRTGRCGILADEMGLGKTVQAIAMIAYLTEHNIAAGEKTLIVAPKSVNGNWLKEFAKWLPSLRVIHVGGDKEERAAKLKAVKSGKFDVLVTSFEIVSKEKSKLKHISWHYLVIDEAHRIKNEKSLLAQTVRELKSHSRLLLTGTPLQNNLHELWALLNFLLPQHFADAEEFDGLSSESAEVVAGRLRKILRPFMLRRLKRDVEAGLPEKTQVHLSVPLSTMQRKLYANVLRRDVDAINGQGGDRSRLLNIMMQLRKACNHPYLFEGQEPGPPFLEGEHIVENSAKLQVLDGLLGKAKEQGAKVLVFSQMTRMLDIIEDYCAYRCHEYCRIDGGVSGAQREEQIDDFMQESSTKFVFLLSTRAGGLGLNLQRANWVVLFDSDWNPQVDIQAMDRAHRIGQTKPVKVFRLVTHNSVEERIVERAMKKLFLDAMVVRHGRFVEKQQAAGRDELLEMIRCGADAVIKMDAVKADLDLVLDFDALLEQGKTQTEELTKRLEKLATGSVSDAFLFDGGAGSQGAASRLPEDAALSSQGPLADFVLDIGKRARPAVNYNDDEVQRGRRKRLRELEQEERARQEESKQAEKDAGWTPNQQMKKVLEDLSHIKGGKPGPADFLLRRLIEEARQLSGSADVDEGAVDRFEFRDRDNYYQGRYDSDGLIVAEVDEGGEEDDQRFPSLASWAFAIKGRTVSVKPVVFYRKKSLRQYEQEAARGAGLTAGEWRGPSDPEGVVSFRDGLLAGVEKTLHVSPDEVQRIVRQEIEGKILKDLSAAVKASGRQEAAAAAAASAARGGGAGPTRGPAVPAALMANVCRTIELASLHKDKEAGVKHLLKRAGVKDIPACCFPASDAGQPGSLGTPCEASNLSLELDGNVLVQDGSRHAGEHRPASLSRQQSPADIAQKRPADGASKGMVKLGAFASSSRGGGSEEASSAEQNPARRAKTSSKAGTAAGALKKRKALIAAADKSPPSQALGVAAERADVAGMANGHWERTAAGARVWVSQEIIFGASDKSKHTDQDDEQTAQSASESKEASSKRALAAPVDPRKAPQSDRGRVALERRGSQEPTEGKDRRGPRLQGKVAESQEPDTSISAQHVASKLVGCVHIRKLFPKYGYYSGEITSFDAATNLYTIKYEDGDEEELGLKGLGPYLPKQYADLVQAALLGAGTASDAHRKGE